MHLVVRMANILNGIRMEIEFQMVFLKPDKNGMAILEMNTISMVQKDLYL